LRRTLIVTGDDFGWTEGVNAAIEAAHCDGVLTTASLMVTGAAVQDAVRRARALRGLSTGLHLVLSGPEVRAACAPAELPDLVDDAGRFPASPARAGLGDFVLWRRRRAQIEREMRAQFARYRETGLPFHHVDGHQHLHLHPLLFDLLLELMEEHRVPWVRVVHEDATARRGPAWAGRELMPWVYRALAARARARLRRRPCLGAPDRLYGFRATGRLDAEEAVRLVSRAEGACVELYAHPDRSTTQGRREEEALRAPALRQAIADAGFALVGTRDLAGLTAAAA